MKIFDWGDPGPKKVALDVDGVLADFTGPVHTYAQIMTGQHVRWEDLSSYDLSAHWPEIKDFMRHHWRSRGFCALIPPIPRTRRAVSILYNVVGQENVKFVTAPMPDTEFWIPERTAWLKYYYKADESKIVYTHDKNVDTESHLLIDDRPENVVAWAKHGKPAILIRQPFNFGFKIPRDLPVGEAEDLEQVVTELIYEREEQQRNALIVFPEDAGFNR